MLTKSGKYCRVVASNCLEISQKEVQRFNDIYANVQWQRRDRYFARIQKPHVWLMVEGQVITSLRGRNIERTQIDLNMSYLRGFIHHKCIARQVVTSLRGRRYYWKGSTWSRHVLQCLRGFIHHKCLTVARQVVASLRGRLYYLTGAGMSYTIFARFTHQQQGRF